MLAYEQKGCWYNSQSGHMPGFWARSPVGGHERQPHINVSLPLSLSLPLSKNKIFFKNKDKVRILLNTRMKNIDNSEQKLYYKFQRTDNIKYRTVSKLRIDKNPLLLGIETLQVALAELFW